MASKNSVKVYAKDAYYHIYNRGVEKRNIFLDQQDYLIFLSYLKTYLTPKDEGALQSILTDKKSTPEEKDQSIKLLRLKNYSSQMSLVCYALLPNHFHLLVKQKDLVLHTFMNSLGTRYAMYFNRKYKRTGVLFQDIYKAVLVNTVEQLLQLSRYIHLNPVNWLGLSVDKWEEAPYPSSLPEYLGKRKEDWIVKEEVLSYFSVQNPQMSYNNFLELPVNEDLFTDFAIDSEA